MATENFPLMNFYSMAKARVAYSVATASFMALAAVAGGAAGVFSMWRLQWSQMDLSFVVLALIAIGIGARVSVRIPRVKGEVTVSDTFIFLTMMLYDGEAAIILALVEALCSSFRFSKTWLTIFFNAGIMGCSTFLTVWVGRAFFGHIPDIVGREFSAMSICFLCAIALTQYASNSTLAAVREALRDKKSVWLTWKESYLWIFVSTVSCASAALVVAKVVSLTGFYAVILILPIIVIVYFTYQTYLKNVEAAEAQTRQAQAHVAELSRYISEQERIREQFSQLEKLSSLGVLASGVAHDFNNSLAAILGRSELMRKYTDDPKILRGLEIIIKSAKDGAKTVKRIQDFARQRQDRNFEMVSVDHVLLDVSEITRPRWKDDAEANGVHIKLNVLPQSGTYVLGDASELRDVLINMVFNAVDAMPEGGTLTLAAEERDEKVLITVNDTGTGMTPDVRARVFDPFFTTKGIEGMGLGLSVSYGIVRRHGGTIKVESEVGKGSTFLLALPQANQAAWSEGDDGTAPFSACNQRCRMTKILVVDDEEPVRELLCDILEDEGVEVTAAANGADALARFEPGKFDAVLTDIGMPGMNGWELLRLINERDQQVPLAVITGWGELVSAREEKAARVDWVLTKPFSMEQICNVAQEISRRRKSQSARSDSLTMASR
jgi:signal transduction histidine kinase/CheY-like chemotaxis protein